MYYLFSVLLLIISGLLVLIVLVQNSKGGGLTSNFASSNQFMGVRKTADFLEKATWTLAGCLLLACLFTTISLSNESKIQKSAIEDQVRNAPDPTHIPNFNQTTSQSTNAKTATPFGQKPAQGKQTLPKH
jgi:preprotein translocase subunit SecG